MAKKCEVCHRTYPDTEPTCPYCAEEAIDVVTDDVEEPASDPPSQKGKRRPAPPPPEVDNIEVVEEAQPPQAKAGPKPPAPPTEPVSPKKTQMSGRVAQPTKLARKSPAPTMLAPADAGEEPPEAAPVGAQKPDTGEHHEVPTGLHEAPKTGDEPTDPKKTQLAGRVAPQTTLARKGPAPTMLAPEEAMEDAAGQEPAGAEKQAKARKPGAPAPKAGEFEIPGTEGAPAPPPTDVLDLGAPPPGAHAEESSDADVLDLLAEGAVPEGASSVNLGAPPSDKGERPSGLDLIAEAVESGVALDSSRTAGHDKDRPAEVEPVAEGAEEDAAAALLGAESSAVDLGGGQEPAHPFSDEPAVAEEEEIPVTAKGPGDEEVGIVDEEAEEAEEVEEAEAVGAGGPPVRTGRGPKPNYGRRWAGGILVGILLAAGAGAGLLYGGIVKLPGKDEKKADTQATNTLRTQLAAANQENAQLQDSLKKAEQERNRLKAENDAAQNQAKAYKYLVATAKHVKKENDLPGVPDAVESLVKERGKLKDQVTDLNGQVASLKTDKKNLAMQLDTEKKGRTAAEGKLAKARASLETALGKEWPKDKELAEGVDLLGTNLKNTERERARLETVRNTVRDKLRKYGHLPPNADTDQLILAGLDKALKQAVSPLVFAMGGLTDALTGTTGDLAGSFRNLYDLAKWTANREARLAYYQSREPLMHSPEQMLDHYAHQLQDRDRADAQKLAKRAAEDARWVLKADAQASPAVKARARYVLGLALRNELDYAAARETLRQAADEAKAADQPTLAKDAREADKDLTDPRAIARRYEEYLAVGRSWLFSRGGGTPPFASLYVVLPGGQGDRILPELNAALKIARASEKGSLLALKAEVLLDKALRSTKKLTSSTPGVEEARRLAEEAVASNAKAEGSFVLGRIAEELGDLSRAVKYYETAAAYVGQKDMESRFRLALGDALLRVKAEEGAEEEKPGKKEEKKEEKSRVNKEARGHNFRALFPVALESKREALSPVACVILPQTILLAADDEQDDQFKQQLANVRRAKKLAEEAIDRGDPNGYLLLGRALAREGHWTEGLMQYVKGVEKLYPGQATVGLDRLVHEHPAFSIPESSKPPQPLLAERHYGLGLEFYWNRKYRDAEREFAKAIEYFRNDARYYYYLGLAQLGENTLKKRGLAFENFRLAKRLEEQGLPDPQDVSAALERVQGRPRRVLDEYRKP